VTRITKGGTATAVRNQQSSISHSQTNNVSPRRKKQHTQEVLESQQVSIQASTDIASTTNGAVEMPPPQR
jgi:hypothetical protein